MSKAVKVAEVSRVHKELRQSSQKSRSRGETQTSHSAIREQESANAARLGALILQTPLFTFVYLPRSRNGGE